MKERPILFSGPMVRALLAGAKTQTRRIVKDLKWIEKTFPGVDPYWRLTEPSGSGPCDPTDPRDLDWLMSRNHYGQPGDRLWVKETYYNYGAFKGAGRSYYRADLGDDAKEPHGQKWKPSIFCTRKASRITLEITGVRVERLNDISEAEAEAEGIMRNEGCDPWTREDGWIKYPLDRHTEDFPAFTAKESYQTLWESINGAGSWALNPWVWVIEFKRITP